MRRERPAIEPAASFAVFVGRAAERARLGEMAAHVPATVIVGVPGVGKSALAHAFVGAWSGPLLRQRAGESLAALLDEAAQKLALALDGDEAARIKAVARALATTAGAWLVDDFDRLAPVDAARLIDTFSAAAGSARLIATSRQALLPSPGVADHAQLRLEPLDAGSGRALWSALDELYGAADGFEAAWQRSHGLPLLLRQAHAGGFDQEDPLATGVRAFDDDERWLAGLLALAPLPLPAESLLHARPTARSALRRLVSRFVVDIDGAGKCSLHALFAPSVRAAIDAEQARALHLVLARLVDALLEDPALRLRHVCACLIAAGHEAEAGEFLVQHAGDLVRRGAAAELLRAIDTIAPERRTLALRLERARAQLRMLDIGRALAELRQLATTPDAPDDLTISLAQVALLTGDARLARDTLVDIVHRGDGDLRLRARAAVTFAVAASYLGHGDTGRARLAELEPRLSDPDQAAVLTGYRAFTLWIEERDDDAADAVRTLPLPSHAVEPLSYRAAAIPAILGVIAARHGRIDEAERSFARSQRVLSRRADPLFQLELTFARALCHHEAGDRLDALKRLAAAHEGYSRAGYFIGTLFVGAWLARALLILGRRVEALDHLARIEAAARASELHGILDGIERARRHDPLRQVLEPLALPRPTRRGLHLRARILSGVQAAAYGDGARDVDLGPAELLAAQGYALDRALLHVTAAVRARLDGDGAAVEAALLRAAAESTPGAPDAFDADLPRALLDAVGRVRVIGPGARRLAVAADDDRARAPVVIDARTHELRHSARTVELRGRPIVRRILYALAASAGRPLSKESLATAAWARDYSPLVHDNPLKSNVGHLRRLVADAGLTVAADELGYRLELPDGAIFIDAV